jgi:urease
MVLKSGLIVWSQMGDANASIPTPQPVVGRGMFGAHMPATPIQGADMSSERSTLLSHSVAFVSQISTKRKENGQALIETYGLTKRIEAVQKCRAISKKDMKWNNALPSITVDPETYEVAIDGVVWPVDAAQAVCMSRLYNLF